MVGGRRSRRLHGEGLMVVVMMGGQVGGRGQEGRGHQPLVGGVFGGVEPQLMMRMMMVMMVHRPWVSRARSRQKYMNGLKNMSQGFLRKD